MGSGFGTGIGAPGLEALAAEVSPVAAACVAVAVKAAALVPAPVRVVPLALPGVADAMFAMFFSVGVETDCPSFGTDGFGPLPGVSPIAAVPVGAAATAAVPTPAGLSACPVTLACTGRADAVVLTFAGLAAAVAGALTAVCLLDVVFDPEAGDAVDLAVPSPFPAVPLPMVVESGAIAGWTAASNRS